MNCYKNEAIQSVFLPKKKAVRRFLQHFVFIFIDADNINPLFR